MDDLLETPLFFAGGCSSSLLSPLSAPMSLLLLLETQCMMLWRFFEKSKSVLSVDVSLAGNVRCLHVELRVKTTDMCRHVADVLANMLAT